MSNHEGFPDPTAEKAIARALRMGKRKKPCVMEEIISVNAGVASGESASACEAIVTRPKPAGKGVPLVYICSRYRGEDQAEVTEHIRLARLYSRFALTKQRVPVTPHLLYPQFLRDKVKTERDIGIQCGLKLLRLCDELWVFYTDGFSEGMRLEIGEALKRGMRIRVFDGDFVEVELDECGL